MTKAKKVLVATYGSLRRGMQNYSVNARGNGKFLSIATSVDDIDLYQYGENYFPSVKITSPTAGAPLTVDLFETDQAGLEGAYDRLEGHNPEKPEKSFYQRTEKDFTLPSGEVVTAWLYHIEEVQPNLICTGDWCYFQDPAYYTKMSALERVEANRLATQKAIDAAAERRANAPTFERKAPYAGNPHGYGRPNVHAGPQGQTPPSHLTLVEKQRAEQAQAEVERIARRKREQEQYDRDISAAQIASTAQIARNVGC